MSDVGREEVRDLLRGFLAQHRGVAPDSIATLEDDRDLFAGGDLDSFGFVELLTWLGDRTGRQIDFTEVDPGRLARVGSLLDHFAGESGP